MDLRFSSLLPCMIVTQFTNSLKLGNVFATDFLLLLWSVKGLSPPTITICWPSIFPCESWMRSSSRVVSPKWAKEMQFRSWTQFDFDFSINLPNIFFLQIGFSLLETGVLTSAGKLKTLSEVTTVLRSEPGPVSLHCQGALFLSRHTPQEGGILRQRMTQCYTIHDI